MELAEKSGKQNRNISHDNLEQDPEILRMAVQVSDVLPYVPQNVIVANLSGFNIFIYLVLFFIIL